MKIERIVNSVFNSNTFILYERSEAVIVDVGDNDALFKILKDRDLKPVAVLITHVHYDHIYGLPDFMKVFPDVRVYTSIQGIESFKNPKWNFSRYHNHPIEIIDSRLKIVGDGGELDIPGFGKIKVMATPGHDHSCLTYKIGNKLFTGDSYIPEVKVVASFPKSDRALAKKWYEKLEELSKSHSIFPGHGEEIKLSNNINSNKIN